MDSDNGHTMPENDEEDDDEDRGLGGLISSLDLDDVVEAFVGSLLAGLVLLFIFGARHRHQDQ